MKRRMMRCFMLRVRRVHQRRVGTGRLVEHGLVVGERVEAGLAVVRPHAAGSHSAEGEIRHGEVHHGVVQRDATGGGVRHDVIEDVVRSR